VIKTKSNKLQIKTKVIIAFVLLFCCGVNYAQTYEIQFGDTINRIDKNGLKQGYWVEKNEKKKEIWTGIYFNGLKENVWKFHKYDGTLINGIIYQLGKIVKKGFYYREEENKKLEIDRARAKSKFIPSNELNQKNDSNIHVRFIIRNGSIYSTLSRQNLNSFLDSVFIEIFEIKSNSSNSFGSINPNKNLYSSISNSQVEYVGFGRNSTKKTKLLFYSCTLKPNKEYIITFSKNKFLSQSIILNTKINLEPEFHLSLIRIYVNLSNRVINLYDPMILGSPTEKYFVNEFAQIEKDDSYEGTAKIILKNKSDYEMKSKIVDLENSVNQQILSLKQEQEFLETQKKLKEEELRHQQEEIKRNQLELELLAKDKAVSALTIKAKEAELLKNMLLANEKKKEIERLNQQKLIDELSIKNKEAEIAKKNIEAENKQKQIHSLEKEKELSNENLKQQKFIQKLMIAGSGLLAVFLVFVFFSLNKSRKANKLIAAQKTEVEKQKVIAEKQKDIAEEQKHLLQEKQTEIIESITYAKRLQEAILPPFAFIDSNIKNNFILYKPKDIVAGDFYWAENIGDLFFIAAADSTGHGVPGAMVSVVCSNALNRSVKEFNLTETGKILDKTKELVVETFEKSTSEVKDGMDISLLCIDTKNKKVFWSGANNPLWYVCSSKEIESHTELVEVKADKQPIGKTDKVNPFTTHEIEYKENTTFYLFTDGFADQFGGPNGKKFKYKPFAEILVQNVNKTPSEQSAILAEKFEAWKGELEQVDDVCIIGVKI
jgi:serine phosphatase RsbU (regulator of sigma subunit)